MTLIDKLIIRKSRLIDGNNTPIRVPWAKGKTTNRIITDLHNRTNTI